MNRAVFYLVTLGGLAWAHGANAANILKVGPDRELKTPSQAAAIAQAGDIVEIDAGVYACDGGVKWQVDDLLIRGIGGKAEISWLDCDGYVPGGKGLWNPTAKNFTVENIRFVGAKVADHNGAGIRYDGGGDFIIRNSEFLNNENGILVTPNLSEFDIDEVNVFIESSEFGYNGYGNGYTHNIYIANTNVFSLVNSYSHNVKTGHLVKSIAKKNFIISNKLEDGMTGTSSYHIDLPGGGPSFVSGNVILQSANSPNYGIISYAAEAREGYRNNPDKRLEISFNTIVNKHPRGFLLNLYDRLQDLSSVTLDNNLVYGLDSTELVVHQQATSQGKTKAFNNLQAATTDFQGFEHDNYYLTETSHAVNASKSEELVSNPYNHAPFFEYQKGVHAKARLIDNKPDVGAFEFDGKIYNAPSIQLSSDSEEIAYSGSILLTWNSEGAEQCSASGSWLGTKATKGQELISGLTQSSNFMLTCTNNGGAATATVRVNVHDSAKSSVLGDLRLKEVENTRLNDLLSINDPILRGVMRSLPETNIDSVFVPQKGGVYIMGGGHRAYFGNEVFFWDSKSQSISLTSPATPAQSLSFFNSSTTSFWDLFAFPNCPGVWTLKSGGQVPASRNTMGTLVYDESVNSLYVQGGMVGCTSVKFSSDGWLFDVDKPSWDLLHEQEPDFLSTGKTHVNYVKDSQLNVISHNSGSFVYNTKNGQIYKSKAQNNSYFTSDTSSVVDDSDGLIVYIGGGLVATMDINNLHMGTDLEFTTDWTVNGDLSLLSINSPAVTYNTAIDKVVAWDGKDKMYVLYIDKANKVIEIVSKHIPNSVFSEVKNNIDGTLNYIESLNSYLFIKDSTTNFYLIESY